MIKITSSLTDIIMLEFESQTPQVIVFNFEVSDDNGNQISTGKGTLDNKNGTKSFALGKSAALDGKYLDIDWTEIDPQGTGATFTVTATVIQNGEICEAVQTFTGKSTDTSVSKSTSDQFKV